MTSGRFSTLVSLVPTCALPSKQNGAGATTRTENACSKAAGRVVELGAGPGLNFAAYPAAVSHVTAIAPDDTGRA